MPGVRYGLGRGGDLVPAILSSDALGDLLARSDDSTGSSLGYEEGRNLVIDVREANGHYTLLPDLAREIVALKPDIIVAEATPAIAAAQKATSTIPIVMSPATDPIGSGFVNSFTHPGGNITGVANMFGDTTTKMLDIIRLVFPNAKKIGVLTSNAVPNVSIDFHGIP
jgi:putative ABC transport system substrate-binding protein